MSPVWKTVLGAAIAAGIMTALESYVKGVQSPKALATSAAVAAAMVVIAYLKQSPLPPAPPDGK